MTGKDDARARTWCCILIIHPYNEAYSYNNIGHIHHDKINFLLTI